jgi:penicillin amidase
MMRSSTEMLRQLGAGVPIEAVCAAAGLTREAFDAWWQAEVTGRVPPVAGTLRVGAPGPVRILRDRWGIPHVVAERDDALFFGVGFAMAQDRLWQMDYLRRRALGRLAEVLGRDGLELDIVARTVGLPRIARAHLACLPAATRAALEAFAAGVNACIRAREGRWPIEFALLDYAPEPWTPYDSLAVLAELRWYLTGRLPVIAIPELAKRVLRDAALYEAFLLPEAGDETILPATPAPVSRGGPLGGGGGGEGPGSNNWAVAGHRSVTGRPLLASDPHIAFGVTSCWYEVHLCGGSFNAAGIAYVGLPALLMGRNARVAWGVTNNLCSQRDLYLERTDPAHPGTFLYDGRWEPARETREEIAVRGAPAVELVVRASRNGPIVDHLLPGPLRDTGPVSLRWLGAEDSDELTCLLDVARADSVAAVRTALRAWSVPTLNFVLADVDGHIAYQCAGRIPIREQWDRAYRPGWDPAHQWRAFVPFDALPALVDPPAGWVCTANNRNAPPDFPFPLSGTWSSGLRARRIRQLLEGQQRFSVEDFARMQLDVLSLRAVDGVPPLLALLEGSGDPRVRRAAAVLRTWDRRMTTDATGAAIFEVFFAEWCRTVAAARFPPPLVDLMASANAGLALALLADDPWGWFAGGDRASAAVEALRRALDALEARLGSDMDAWTWGRVHTIPLRHALSGRGDLGTLLDRGGVPVHGSGVTVCNTGYDPNYLASLGANYRLIADLAADPPALWAVDAAGTSGEPGSPHYGDQLPEWLAGRYHRIPLDRALAEREAAGVLVLEEPLRRDDGR